MTPLRLCPTLVARDAEWAILDSALRALRSGTGGFIALLGEAGIGKSRLVAEVVEAARGHGVPLLLGRAVESPTPAPFRPLFEALSEHARRDGSDARTDQAGLRAALAPIVPAWRNRDEQPYRASPMELGDALLRYLATLGGEHGCVLVLEDLHWADPDTAAVLEYIGDNAAGAGVLCVVTARDIANEALRVIRSLVSRRAGTALDLRRLDAADLVQMTEQCLDGKGISGDVEDFVKRFSDGLPFLVEELLTASIDNGSLVDGPDGWRVEPGTVVVPHGFDELVRRRVALLDGQEAGVIRAAAMLGRRFDPELLPLITGLGEERVIGALRRGVTSQLLVVDPGEPRAFAFRHALTRDALLAQLLPLERAAHARRILAALDEHHPDLPGELCELAASLAEEAGDRRRAASLLLLAARRTLDRGLLSSAVPTLDRALRLADRDSAVWADVGLTLVEVLTDTGDVDRSLEIGGRLLADLPASGDRAAIHLGMARAASAAGRWNTAEASLQRARAAAGPDAPDRVQAAADAIAGEIAIGRHDYDQAVAFARRALAAAERVDDPALACQALLLIGRWARHCGSPEMEPAFDRVVDLGLTHGLPVWHLRGVMEQGSVDLSSFRPPERLQAARDRVADGGALVVAAYMDNFLTWSCLDHHDPVEADAAARRGAALAARMRLPVLEGVLWCGAASAAGQRGDRPLLDQHLARAMAVSDGHADVVTLSPVARVEYFAWRSEVGRLMDELDVAMDLLRAAPHLPIPVRGMWALLRVFTDRDAGAALAEYATDPATNHTMGRCYRHYATAIALGRSGDGDGAVEEVRRGDEGTEHLGWFQHHARRFVAEAALADGWGTPVEWLIAANAEFERRGEDHLAGTCRRLLAGAGASLPRRPAEPGGVPADLHDKGVTARELEVLELLATATATKDIAARLYLSPKTVERHIANLATKLDVGGRAGLVAFAAARLR